MGDRVPRQQRNGALGADDGGIEASPRQRGLGQDRPDATGVGRLGKNGFADLFRGRQIALGKGLTCGRHGRLCILKPEGSLQAVSPCNWPRCTKAGQGSGLRLWMPPAQIKKTLGLLWTEGEITPQVTDRRAVGGGIPTGQAWSLDRVRQIVARTVGE